MEVQDSLEFWRDSRRWFPISFLDDIWTPIVSGIPDSLSCIPDSKAQDLQFLRQRFPGLRNPDFLEWSDPLVVTWSNLVPRAGKKHWERGCTWSSSGDAVECLHESRVCISIVLWLAHFAPHFSEEVGRRSWHHNVLLQTAFNHCIQWLHRGKTGQSILIITIVSTTANNKPFLDVVHHWSRLLQWAIWVTKPIFILTFSYRPKSSSIMYCKAIYPSGLWLLTNDDCCAKNKVVSRVLAPARSW